VTSADYRVWHAPLVDDRLINGANVARKAIDNSADGRDIKEPNRCLNNVVEQPAVKLLGSAAQNASSLSLTYVCLEPVLVK
jgi:hypothetical protein